MNIQAMTEQFGFNCHILDENSGISLIETPFNFFDGEPLPIYTQEINSIIRLFDGGETLLHFAKRGLDLNKIKGMAFINTLIEPFGVTLTSSGELEIFSEFQNSRQTFSKFIYAMFAITNWEYEQDGKSIDDSILVEEVAMYFKTAYPNENQMVSGEFTGISGHRYKFDFIHGDKAVLAISTHHAAVASAIKKIVDINLSDAEPQIKPFIVIDDRKNRIAAINETKVLSALAQVMSLTTLEKKASFVQSSN